MKLHPVHMLFVHFPAALLPMDIVFSGVALFSGNEALASAGFYCLVAGVVGGWIAVLTGLYDLFVYLMIPQSGGSNKGIVHGSVQSIAVVGFTIILSLEYKAPGLITDLPVWMLIVKILLVLTLLVGNYIGGELLFRYVAKNFGS